MRLATFPYKGATTAAVVFENDTVGLVRMLHERDSAPDIADKNLANPTALLLSGLMLLEHIGERERADRIRAALDRVLAAGVVRTRDLGGTASTTEFTDAICKEIER